MVSADLRGLLMFTYNTLCLASSSSKICLFLVYTSSPNARCLHNCFLVKVSRDTKTGKMPRPPAVSLCTWRLLTAMIYVFMLWS